MPGTVFALMSEDLIGEAPAGDAGTDLFQLRDRGGGEVAQGLVAEGWVVGLEEPV